MKLYHYTNLDALIGILRKEHICFWGTRYDSMNDPTDYSYARDFIIPKLREFLDKTPQKPYEYIPSYPYIVSFSKEKDDFNMWRMYNADIALEFESDTIDKYLREYNRKENNIQFQLFGECKYVDDNNIEDKFVELFNKAEQCDDIFLTAQEQVSLLKRKEFENENEFRLYTFDRYSSRFIGKTGEFIDCEIPVNIKVKCVRNRDIVFYKEFHLPKEALTGIIINSNDNAHFKSLKTHILLWLIQQNYTDLERNIIQSKSILLTKTR